MFFSPSHWALIIYLFSTVVLNLFLPRDTLGLQCQYLVAALNAKIGQKVDISDNLQHGAARTLVCRGTPVENHCCSSSSELKWPVSIPTFQSML